MCRTANGIDINAEPGTNPQTKDGRGKQYCPSFYKVEFGKIGES